SKKYLIEKRGRALLVMPGSHAPAATLAGVEATEQGIHERTDINAAEKAVRIAPGSLQHRVLDNGLMVFALERPGTSFFTAVLGFLDGAARRPNAVAEAAGMSTATYISKPPAGIAFSRYSEADSARWVVRSNVSALDLGLEGLYERLTHHDVFWKFPNFLDWLKVAEKGEKPLELATRALRHDLLGASPLVSPAPRELDPVTVQDIRNWMDAVYRPENGALVIVGPDASRALEFADEHMSSWKRGAPRAPVVPPAASIDPKQHAGFHVSAIDRSDLAQTELVAGCLLPPSSEASAPKEDVLAGLLDAKLDWQLRQKTGSTYGVWTGVERLRGGLSLLSVTTAIGSEQLSVAVPLLLDALRGKTPLVSEQSVAEGRWMRFRDLALNGGTTPAFADRIFEYYRLGWPMAALESYPDRVKSVTADEVEALLRYCSQHLAFTALGDGSGARRFAGGDG
ncbi:MAG TPA: insulinase family protein, partial [Polyangiaceae bacterium]|nr:insulinase family protein [Polyangiaceae bacterium]